GPMPWTITRWGSPGIGLTRTRFLRIASRIASRTCGSCESSCHLAVRLVASLTSRRRTRRTGFGRLTGIAAFIAPILPCLEIDWDAAPHGAEGTLPWGGPHGGPGCPDAANASWAVG